MTITARTWRGALASAAGCLALAGSLALAQGTQGTQGTHDTKPAKPTLPGKDQIPGKELIPTDLPPGMTAEEFQACMEAATPGPMHAFRAKYAGTWTGTTEMWPGPGTDAMTAEFVNRVTPMMDGRFFRTEVVSEMPGMGSFQGFGIIGFDNVTQKFVGSWVDNFGTGIANGVGELSPDGKTINWVYTYNCPITKKPVSFRQVESFPDENTSTIEMFMTDPKTGTEFKSMRMESKRLQM